MKLPRPSPRLAARFLAVFAVVGFLWLVARFWNPAYGLTAFLQVDANNGLPKVAAFTDYPVYLYRSTGGYDGQFYSQIASDPTLTSPALAGAIDNLAYRGMRILMPAAVWLMSAGRPALIAQFYAGFDVLCWLALAALLWRVLAVTDLYGWLAWAGVLFSAGVLSSVRLALTDLPALLAVTAAIWLVERARPRTAAGWLAAAALTRETALVAWPAFWFGGHGPRRTVTRALGYGLAAAAPLLAWLGYLRWRVGPLDAGSDNLAWPLIGFVDRCREMLAALPHANPPALVWTWFLALLGLSAQVFFILLRPRGQDPWWRVGVGFVVLAAFLGASVWEGLPIAALRVLVPLTLACNVLAVRTRAPLAWLLACNLSVGAGLLQLGRLPLDRWEMAAARRLDQCCVIRLGSGWYGKEVNPHHHWSWSPAGGTVDLECWPRTQPVRVQVTLRLQSLTPAEAVITRQGRKIWSGPVALRLTTVELPPMTVDGGRLQLKLASNAPPVREPGGAGARLVGFALFDPAVRVLPPAPSPP